MFRSLLLACCLLCCAAPLAAQTTVAISYQSAYLHLDPADIASEALAISLGALGLAPGYTIQLAPAGDWDAGPGGDTQTILLGVFSANPTLLGSTLPHRVPGAIDAGVDNFSGGTWPSNEPTEIPEDFTIDAPSITIVIPPGATHLFVTPADIYYRDNEDPDGDLGVTITLISPTSVPHGGSHRLLSARPSLFDHETSIGFRLEIATSARLTVHDITGRLVRTLVAGSLPSGNHVVRWDGRDASGRLAASGSYFARLEGGGRAETTRMSLVR